MKAIILVALSCVIAAQASPVVFSLLPLVGTVGDKVGAGIGSGVGLGLGTAINAGVDKVEKVGSGILNTGLGLLKFGTGIVKGLGKGAGGGFKSGLELGSKRDDNRRRSGDRRRPRPYDDDDYYDRWDRRRSSGYRPRKDRDEYYD